MIAVEEHEQPHFNHVQRAASQSQGYRYDNAPMESFFKTFKVDEVYHEIYETHEQAVRAANEHIERSYNPTRLHSAPDYVSPTEFEQRLLLK